MEVSLQGATHSLLQPAKCQRQRPVLVTAGVRRPPLRSAESHSPEEAERLTSMTEVTAVPSVSILQQREAAAALCSFFSLSLGARPGSRSSLCFSRLPVLSSLSSRRLTFNSGYTVDSRVPPAGSEGSEQPLQLHEAVKQGNCVNLPAANEPACVRTAKLDLIGLR